MHPSGTRPGDTQKTDVEPPEPKDMNEQSIETTSNVKLNARAKAMIGQRLKAVYNDLVQEPVPEHLLQLLEELERKEGKE